MNELNNVINDELIDLLIKYRNITGYLFPIGKVKSINNEELIKRIKICISEKKRYDLKLFKLNNIQIMTDDVFEKIIPLIKQNMEEVNYDYINKSKEIIDIINLRKCGKKFSFSEHLSALIFTLLNNNRWGDTNIKENKSKIYSIFHDFDKNYLKLVDPNELINELKKLHCSNPAIKKQLYALSYNINILEKIEEEHNSLDEFILKNDPNDIAICFSEGKYKLKQVGKAITFDYLKMVGIDCCKYSIQIGRLFGKNRLAIVSNEIATFEQILSIIKKLSKINKISEIEIELILQQFCLSKSANICGEFPQCEKCRLKSICNYNK